MIDMEGNYLKTGTTTIGIKCKDGVVLAADKRAGAGIIVDKRAQKVYKITDFIALTMAGTASDAQLITKLISAELRLMEIRKDKHVTVKEAAKNFTGYTLITIKSTIPIGFEDDLEKTAKKFATAQFEFASSPEFLREGTAIEDTLHPARIVIGTTSKKAQKILLELHAPISGQRIICDMRSAQLIKYASNAILATKVSFSNALAVLCEKAGADIEKVLEGVGSDKRIGRSFLYPGIGYGGSCLPKDILAFIAISENFDYDFNLLRAVDAINQGQILRFVNKIRFVLEAEETSGKNLAGKKLAILGLSFKPHTDDIRDAPSIKIINHLTDLGAEITVYDPQAMENTKRILPNIKYAKDVYGALDGKDALILITEWPQFQELDLTRVKRSLKSPIIIDGRNMFDIDRVKQLGFKYVGIGR